MVYQKRGLHTERDEADILDHTVAPYYQWMIFKYILYFLDVYVSRELSYEEDLILL